MFLAIRVLGKKQWYNKPHSGIWLQAFFCHLQDALLRKTCQQLYRHTKASYYGARQTHKNPKDTHRCYQTNWCLFSAKKVQQQFLPSKASKGKTKSVHPLTIHPLQQFQDKPLFFFLLFFFKYLVLLESCVLKQVTEYTYSIYVNKSLFFIIFFFFSFIWISFFLQP